jgi:2-polyprenyl-6-methoxyphenol hydroxylase-like FAD-dependent oxidoreductase
VRRGQVELVLGQPRPARELHTHQHREDVGAAGHGAQAHLRRHGPAAGAPLPRDSEFESNKADIEGNFLKVIDLPPNFASRLRRARREERFAGMAVPGYFRKPFGPGWALVGDAGYNKDFITAQGIQDAFRDAELCVRALDEAYSGRRPFQEAMADYQAARDEHVLPMYELTADIASLEPPPPELQQILEAAHGNQEAMDGFARVNAGVTSPREFFSEENVQRICRPPADFA